MTYDRGETPPALQLNFQQLAYLRQVDRAGTLTEAATRLHVSQPALSQSLSELERRLGVTLFERDGRRRTLTEAGRELVRFANEVLARASAMQDWLEAHARGETGTLRVGLIDAAGLYLLPRTIRAFRAAHPAVELRLVVDSSGPLLERLAAFDLDLAFVIGPIEGAFDTVEVLREPLYVYAPTEAPEPPSEAAWALYPAGSQTRQLIDEALLHEGVRPNVTLESSNPEILRQMVSLGLGWSVLPATVAEAARPRLRRHRGQPLAERTLLAARRRGAPPDPRIDALLRLAATRGGRPTPRG